VSRNYLPQCNFLSWHHRTYLSLSQLVLISVKTWFLSFTWSFMFPLSLSSINTVPHQHKAINDRVINWFRLYDEVCVGSALTAWSNGRKLSIRGPHPLLPNWTAEARTVYSNHGIGEVPLVHIAEALSADSNGGRGNLPLYRLAVACLVYSGKKTREKRRGREGIEVKLCRIESLHVFHVEQMPRLGLLYSS
jgi:hypothetical protein